MEIKSHSTLVKKEVNLIEFINQARSNAKSGNLNLARYYLKLVLTSPSCENNTKILASAIQSFIAAKKGELDDLRVIAWSFILKYAKHFTEYEEVDEEQYLHYTKALCRAAKEESKFQLGKGFNLTPSFFLWKANLFTSRNLNDSKQDIKNQVKEDYFESLNSVSIYVSSF